MVAERPAHKQDVERFRRGQVVLAKTEDIQGDTSQNLAVVAPEDGVWLKRNAETAPVELAADSDYRAAMNLAATSRRWHLQQVTMELEI